MKTTRNTSSRISLKRRWQKGKSAFIAPSTIVLFVVMLLGITCGQRTFGQGVGISETSITPHASAILELQSVLRGFLAPRMTTSQRTTLGATAAQGLLVYDTDTKCFWYFDAGWKIVRGSANIGGSNQLLGMNLAGTENEYKTLNGTTNQVIVNLATPGNITLSLPQSIHTGASPIFSGLTVSGLAANSGIYTDGSSKLTSSPPSTGTLGYWNRSGSILSPTNAGDAITTSGNIYTSGTGAITSAGLLTGSSGATIAGGTVNINNGSNYVTNINTGSSTGAVTIGNSLNSITLPAFGTAGVVHNAAGGVLSSSLIVNADITNGTIVLPDKITGVLPVPNGGTGHSTLPVHGVLVGNAGSAISTTSTGNAGQVLQSRGSGSDPSYSTAVYPTTTTINQLLYSSTGDNITGLSTAGNGVLITSAGGVPSISSILPFAVQDNITRLGTIGTGTWQGNVLSGQYGGTGIANTGKTITLGGNILTGGSFTTTPSNDLTLTTSAATNVTLPTSGTLYGTKTGSVNSVELATTLTDETGTGGTVFANTPTLITPILGVATATSVNGLVPTSQPIGFTISGGTVSKTLTVIGDATISGSSTGNNTGDVTLTGENYLSLTGQALTANAVDLSGTNATGTLAAGRFPALTGDVTTSAGSLGTTISNDAVTTVKIKDANVTDAKIATVSGSKVTGDITGNAANVNGIVLGANGGTGIANTGRTITLGGNVLTGGDLTTSGAFATTLTTTAATNVTLPTSGTLYGTKATSVTSNELATTLSDETGTGAAVFANTPILVTPELGAATGTSLALGGGTALTTTNRTGTGNLVLENTPTLITPILGVATATSVNGLVPTSQPIGFTISGGTVSKTLTVIGDATISGSSTGNNTGDVTLTGENYLSLTGQALTANAVDLSGTNATGTLAAGRFPALTGDVTTSAGSLGTTISNDAVTTVKIKDANVTDAKIATVSGSKVTGDITGNAANVNGIVLGANGGTGIANTGRTITLGGNVLTGGDLTTSGAFATTLTTTAATNVTLPTSGTLYGTKATSVTSNELATTLSDETGTGAAVFANTPILVTPELGAATGTSLALGGGTALTTTNRTGTGNLVLENTPTLITPILGVATATSVNGLVPTSQPIGFTISGGTVSKTLTVIGDATISGSSTGNNTGDVTLTGENYLSLTGQALTANAVDLSGTNATGTLAAGRFPALTGDVTTSAGSLGTTISNDAVTTVKIKDANVTDAKIATVSGSKVTGDITGNAANVNGIVLGANGGTGIANTGRTITLGGNVLTGGDLTTSGAFATTLTTTAATNVTLPTSGTLYGTKATSVTSNELATTLSDETGTGAAVFANTPILVTPELGAATGTSLALGGGTALTTTNRTGTGNLVLENTPTLITPILGVATATSVNGLVPTSQLIGFTISGGTVSKTLTVIGDATISGSSTGNNTGDVTLTGENYLSLTGQALTANAVDLSGTNATGTLAAGRFPALTGDVTTSAGSLGTTISNDAVTTVKIKDANVTDAKIATVSGSKVTGDITGNAANVNGIVLGANGGTGIANTGRTITLGGNVLTGGDLTTSGAFATTLTTTAATNVTLPTSGTLYGTKATSVTSNELATTLSDETGTGAAVFANTPILVTPELGAATGTSLALGGGTALTTTNRTGTGNLVLENTPTLITPILGVATATSVNGLVPTSQPIGFTISGGTVSKTLTVIGDATISGSSTGNNTGDVTLTGENYLSLTGQALTANAVDLSGTNATGTLAAGRFPALTGDVTTSAGSLGTTISNDAVTTVKIKDANVTDAKIATVSGSKVTGDITGNAANVNGIVLGANGGTGIANTGRTITLGGNVLTEGDLTTSGAFATTLTTTAATNVTLPTSGTLYGTKATSVTSNELATTLSDETGTGAAVFANTPILVTPELGAATGTSLALGGGTALTTTNRTGTGNLVLENTPTLITPILGVATATSVNGLVPTSQLIGFTISGGTVSKTLTVIGDATISGSSTGNNTGDVTLTGENYLSLTGQALTANAVDLSGTNATGTLAAGRFPALTGDVTTSAGSLGTTISNDAVTTVKIKDANVTDAKIATVSGSKVTGDITGNAANVNGIVLGANGGTGIANTGRTITLGGNVLTGGDLTTSGAFATTLTTTAATNVTLPTSGTLYGTKATSVTSNELATTLSDETGTGAAVFANTPILVTPELGAATGTSLALGGGTALTTTNRTGTGNLVLENTPTLITPILGVATATSVNGLVPTSQPIGFTISGGTVSKTLTVIGDATISGSSTGNNTGDVTLTGENYLSLTGQALTANAVDLSGTNATGTLAAGRFPALTGDVTTSAGSLGTTISNDAVTTVKIKDANVTDAKIATVSGSKVTGDITGNAANVNGIVLGANGGTGIANTGRTITLGGNVLTGGDLTTSGAFATTLTTTAATNVTLPTSGTLYGTKATSVTSNELATTLSDETGTGAAVFANTPILVTPELGAATGTSLALGGGTALTTTNRTGTGNLVLENTPTLITPILGVATATSVNGLVPTSQPIGFTISGGTVSKTLTVIGDATISGSSTGNNTGDVTLTGENYLSLTGQALTANAVDLSGTNATGTLAAGRFPALTGDVTTSAGSLGTTISNDAVTTVKIKDANVTDAKIATVSGSKVTGDITGNAANVNGIVLGANGGTGIANTGRTITLGGNVLTGGDLTTSGAFATTLTTTAATNVTLPTSGTLYGTKATSVTSNELATTLSDETGTGAAVFANTPILVTPELGAATGTSLALGGGTALTTTNRTGTGNLVLENTPTLITPILGVATATSVNGLVPTSQPIGFTISGGTVSKTLTVIGDATISGSSTGNNTGDVTLTGENYLSLTGQALTANAVDLSGTNATGTLAAGRFPALTGDVTTSAGSLGTTISNDAVTTVKIKDANVTDAKIATVSGSKVTGDITGNAANVNGIVLGANGGTGIANTGRTITLGGNVLTGGDLTTSGAFATTLTTTAATNVTLPTSGTLYGTKATSVTSNELATTLSDETGTGAAVFANTPILVTPELGAATGTSLALGGGTALTTTNRTGTGNLVLENTPTLITPILGVATATSVNGLVPTSQPIGFTISGGTVSKTLTVIGDATISGSSTGNNTGDVTLTGENYLSLTGQALTANAVDLSGTNATGTLAAGRFPALTGDVTTSAGSLGTTISNDAVTTVKIKDANVTDAKIATVSGSKVTGDITGNAANVNGIVLGANGGTGIANTGRTITLGGNVLTGGDLTTSGAFATTLTTTAATNVTLPTSGTLYGTKATSVTSNELATTLSDETGTGAAVFANTPILVTPELGAATGTSLALGGGTALTTTNRTGTGNLVLENTPTLITPILGVATATSVNGLVPTSQPIGFTISGGTVSKTLTVIGDATISGSSTGNNTGDVTLTGENYLSLTGQALTANAVDLSGTNATGTLAAGRFPALTGDVTTSAGSLGTTISNDAVTTVKIKDANVTDAKIATVSGSKVTGDITGNAANVNGIVLGANGGTGIANTGRTITLGGNVLTGGDLTTSGAFATTLTTTAATNVTLPTSGTLYGTKATSVTSNELATTLSDETGTGAAVFANTPILVTPELGAATGTSLALGGGTALTTTNRTGTGNLVLENTPTLITPILGVATATSVNGLVPTSQPIGFTISGGTVSKTLTVIGDATISGSSTGNNTGDVTLTGENYLSLTGQALTANAVDLSGTNATGTLAAGRFPALTGDVTTSAGSLGTTISNDAVTTVKIKDANVTDAKIATVSGSKVTGDITGNAANVNGIVLGANGGTGIANTGRTITLGGNVLTGGDLTTSGAFATTLTTTAATNVTLPTSGTLYGTKATSVTSNELATTLSDETGTGAAVFANTPILVTPELGAATGTSLALGGGTALTTTNRTGTGNLVLENTPTLITPILGVATATSVNGLVPTSQPIGFTISGGTVSKTLTVIGDATISGSSTGNNTGDVTLTGENYLSLTGQALTANAVDLSGTNATGTLAAGRFPALTGDVTTSAGSLGTTISNDAVTTVKIKDANVTDAKIATVSGSKVTGDITGNAANVNGIVLGANGGTGIANTGRTITLGGNVLTGGDLTTSGAFATTLTTTAATNVTLPTSGTLYGTKATSVTSNELATTLSDETGTGAAVFANTPILVTPELGAATGTSLALGGGTALTTTNRTGTGNLVLENTPTLITPILGVATATSVNGLVPTSQPIGFTISGGTVSKTLTVIGDATISGSSTGNNTGDVTLTGENYLSLTGQALTANAVDLSGTNATGTLAAGRFPALTGDVTTSAGSLGTTISNDAVTTVKIKDANVTDAKIATVSGSKVTGDITGNAANVTGTVAIVNGGTGQSTQQLAINALAGGVTSGRYLRGDGTNVVLSTIQAADIPNNAANTSGTAANVTGIVSPINGGTGIANNASSTLAISGNFGTTLTVTGATSVSLPTSGTLLTTTGNGSGLAGLTGGQITGNIAGNAANVTGIVLGANGGTGIANSGKTITLGGNVSTAADFNTAGAFATTLTTTALTNVTLPTSGTLATLGGVETLTNKTLTSPVINSPTGITKADVGLGSVENTAISTWAGTTNVTTLGTIGTGTWQAGIIAGQYGGTGVNNSGKTITLGGNLTTSGAFATTLTTTALTNLTLPTGGTLATLAGNEALTNKTINGNTITAGTGILTIAAGATLNATASATVSGTNTGDQTLAGLNGVPNTRTVNGKSLSSDITLGLASTDFSNQGTVTTLLHGNAAGAPSFGAVGLTTDVTGLLPGTNGGTGVNNGAKTITLGGNLTTSGAFATTLTTTALTNVTLPTSGTLATLGGVETLTNKTLTSPVINSPTGITKADVGLGSVENTAISTWAGTTNVTTLGTIGTGTWQAGIIAGQYGGTGVNNSGKTITLGGNLTTSGAFATTLTTTALTNLTLPTGGTLATLAGNEALTNKTINGNTITAGTGILTIAAGATLNATASATVSGTNTGDQTLAGLNGVPNTRTVNGKSLSSDITLGLASTDFSNQGTVTTLLHGNAAGAPSFGAVGLTTDVTGLLPGTNGGTGVNNGAKTITLGGNLTTSGAFATTLTTTALTNVTLPTSGTLATLGGVETLTNKTLTSPVINSPTGITKADVGLGSVENTAISTWAGTTNVTTLGTIGTGTWQAGIIAGQYGGTGVNNSGKTITLGGNLTTSGAFATTLTTTALTNLTLPTGGTLATLAGNEALTNKTINGNTITAGTGILTIAAGATLNATASATVSGTNTGDQTLAGLNGVPNTRTVNGKSLSSDITLGLASTDFSNQGTVTTLLHGNAAGAPSFGAVGLTTDVTGLLPGTNGGTGVNNGAKTITLGGNLTTSGAFATTLTTTALTNVTLPTSGTLATLAGTESLSNKTVNGLTPTALATGFSIAGGTTSKTLAVSNSLTLAGTDGSTLNIAGGGTLGSNAYSSTAYAPLASPTFTGTVTTPTLNLSATSNQLVLQGTAATGTISWTPTTSNKTITFPDATGTVALTGSTQTQTFLGDLMLDATGTTWANPRKIGMNNWNIAGNAARYSFGDQWNALQSSYAGKMQLTSYWGIEIIGNRENPVVLDFATGSAADPSLNVIGTSRVAAAGATVLAATAGTQSGNLQEWRNSAGTALATVNSTGDILSSGGITSSGSSGIGYETGAGAGGTVTQVTNKATGVIINKITGQITTNAAALGAGVGVSFVVTNSTVAATDVPFVAIASGATNNTYVLSVTSVAAGSFRIGLTNVSASSQSDALVLNFVIIKGANN